MIRKTLTFLSLLGLLLSVGLWGVSCSEGWSHTYFYIGEGGEEIGITFICADGRIGWDAPGDMLNSVPYPDYGVSLWLPTVVLAGAFLFLVFQRTCERAVRSFIWGTVRVARRVGMGFGLVALKLRRPLIVFSLTGLLLGVGLWAASYFSFRMWWGENQAHLVTGKIYWGQVMPRNTPFAWRCEGFHGFNLKGLKPYFPPKDWGFRRALPPGHGHGGKRPPNVVLPGITIRWTRVIDTNGIGSWSYSATILLWVPSLLFGIILCLCRPRHLRRRRKRKKLGLCLNCGYNLKGLTEPRCPECNTSFDERLLKKDA